MSTLQMQAFEMIGQLSESKLQLVVDIMKSFSSSDQVAPKNLSKRIGIAKGEFVVPEDIDECNDEIAKMFGVE